MVIINKQEAQLIKQFFGKNVNVTRTCKQKSNRHRYYMSEQEYAMDFINAFRDNPEKALSKKWVAKGYSWFY